MVFDAEMGFEVDLDISVAHPWCPDVICKDAKEDGAAALKRDRKNQEKYEKELLSGGRYPSQFIPLVPFWPLEWRS